MKLTKAEKNIINWIAAEWEPDFVYEASVYMGGLWTDSNGNLLPKLSQSNIESLVKKEILESGEITKNKQGLLSLDVTFYPIPFLEAYSGVEFTKLKDPLGRFIVTGITDGDRIILI